MKRFLIAGILLAVSACAFAQRYIPLQLTHEGHWYAPERGGEGVHFSIIDGEKPQAFVVVFGLTDDGRSYWASAQAETARAWDPVARSYVLELYQRPAPNAPPEIDGWIVVRTRGDKLVVSWHVVSLGIERADAEFSQLTMPVFGYFGWCNAGVGFSPSPPAAAPRFCG